MTSSIEGDMTEVQRCSDAAVDAVDSVVDWDEYAARIAQSSQQHITRLIDTIKRQQHEIALLRARLQSSPPPTPASAHLTPVTGSEQHVSCDHRTAAEGTGGSDRSESGNKRSRDEMEGAERSRSEQLHDNKRRTQQTNDTESEETSDANTAAHESIESEPPTQPLSTLVVNILPPSPVKPVDAASAAQLMYEPPHNLDTQPLDHDTQPPHHHHTPHPPTTHQQQQQGGLTAADRLFDELTEQEVSDADTRRKRLEAQSVARTAFNAMKQQHYTTTVQLLTTALTLLPLPTYPPSFLRARLTCYAKLGRRREMTADAELMWSVWQSSVSAFMRGTVECRGRRYQQAAAWLREAEWRKREEERREKEQAVERQMSGLSVQVEEAEDVWLVTAEEREMRVVSLQSIRDSLSKVEQRIANDSLPQSSAAAVKQSDSKQQQVVAALTGSELKGGDDTAQPRVTVVDEKGKGGKRVTFVVPQSQTASVVPTVP